MDDHNIIILNNNNKINNDYILTTTIRIIKPLVVIKIIKIYFMILVAALKCTKNFRITATQIYKL